MKKYCLVILSVLLCAALTGCCLSHEWQEATCTAPKTCASCGKTEGDTLAHHWEDATCVAPKTCTLCGTAEGSALGHSWSEPTCTEDAACTVCGEAGAEALGHDMLHLSFDQTSYSGSCRRCETEVSETVEDWASFAATLAVGRKQACTLLNNNAMFTGEGNTTEGLPEQEYLALMEDHTVTMLLKDITYTGTWSFLEYNIRSEASDYLQFVLDFGEEGKAQAHITTSLPNTMSVRLSSSYTAIFSEDELMVTNAQRQRENQNEKEAS